MNGTQHSKRQRPPARNATSDLLTDQENSRLFTLLGKKCVTLATGVAQVFLADGAGSAWNKRCTGVCCFVKDNIKRSYFIRVYSLKRSVLQWEQEMYNEFKYSAPRPYFLTFDTNDCRAALNFANENEADKFRRSVDEKIRAKNERRHYIANDLQKKNSAPPLPAHHKPPTQQTHQSTNLTIIDAKSVQDESKKKKKKNKKSKLTKADISSPSGFQHVTHVGWDPNRGFDMNNVDPSVKELFASAGVTEKDMEDEETVKFIYDFIEQKGGIDAVKKDQENRKSRRPPPMPPTHGAPPPPPRKEGMAPPPPRRADIKSNQAPPPPRRIGSTQGRAEPPPPPNRAANRPSAPPPLPSGIPAPPPPPSKLAIPPPPPVLSGAPPPPPVATPQMSAGRGDLLAQIREGNPGLKPASERSISSASGSGRGALLDQIRSGASLKPVTDRGKISPTSTTGSDSGGGGLASALKSALEKREKTIHSDSESDSDDFEDDWSD